MDVKELIKKALDVSKEKTINVIVENIDENCVFKHLYKEVYGNTLIPELCNDWISKLGNAEGHGAKWSLEETNSVAKRLDYDFASKNYTPEEFRLVMHKEYYTHSIPLRKSNVALEATGWGRLADDYLTNHKCNLVNEYFCE